ncbi:MAG: hypothetical protein K2X90_01165 [Candidatus Babeliaceae bacterium]|nr:hypothetical protein [Candidatus Babeliaceae bacterium]
MKKIILLASLLPLLVVSKGFELPDDLPVYNDSLTPQEKYNEAYVLLSQVPLISGDPFDDERSIYRLQLYERYLNDSADQGHERAIEWRIEKVSNAIKCSKEKVTAEQIAYLKQQLEKVKDPQVFAPCDLLLTGIIKKYRSIIKAGR